MTKRLLAACFGLLLFGTPSFATTIRFDEFPADNNNGGIPAGRYAGLGVTFLGTDDGTTWGGISNGDPGNWGVNGTNGPIFSGYNGDSYNQRLTFNSLISNFSLDVSRTNGSSASDTFTLQGWRLGVMVLSVSGPLGPINTWTTFGFGTNVDEVRWFGTGANFHPYGVDNLNWTAAVPEPTSLLLLASGLAGIRRLTRKRTR
jgi:hypothetical protein